MTKSAIIVAKDNGYGLTVDVGLFLELLTGAGLKAEHVTPRARPFMERLFRKKRADVVFHVERAFPNWFSAGATNILVPHQERFPRRHIGRLRGIDSVWAKTFHAQEVFGALGCTTHRIEFISRDRFLPEVDKDFRRFFHLAGGSTLKGTETILDLWNAHPEWPELVLVQKAVNAPKEVPANVTLLSGFLDDGELQRLQNACGIHLCPSKSEGWGHHIHEGFSCGAVVVTTDGPPMSEYVDGTNGIAVAYSSTEPRHLGTNYNVDRAALETVIERIIASDIGDLAAMGAAGRASFLARGERAKASFVEAVGTL